MRLKKTKSGLEPVVFGCGKDYFTVMKELAILAFSLSLAFGADGPAAAGKDSTSPEPDSASRIKVKLLGSKDADPKRTGVALSPAFILNTLNPESGSASATANGLKYPLVLVGEYAMTGKVWVRAAIYQKKVMVRRLFEEFKTTGTHQIYWDGTDESGEKLSGDLKCVVIYIKNEKEKRIDFDVRLDGKK